MAKQTKKKSVKAVKSLLVSQPEPTHNNSPYYNLGEKYDIHVDFRPFIEVEGITAQEFRKNKLDPLDYTAIILTSRSAADHFFRMCDELRIQMPKDTQYFCKTEAIALYLQNYIQYRKRKVHFGEGRLKDMFPILEKHKEEKFLFACSDDPKQDIPNFLKEKNIDFDYAPLYRPVPNDLSDIENFEDYDMLVFYSPSDVESLLENFPDYKQGDTRIAAFGSSTCKAVRNSRLRLDIEAPQEGLPSMSMAIEKYIKGEYQKD